MHMSTADMQFVYRCDGNDRAAVAEYRQRFPTLTVHMGVLQHTHIRERERERERERDWFFPTT
jgi:cytosine/adenosine deaminase-related metal-dependent hydrolase